MPTSNYHFFRVDQKIIYSKSDWYIILHNYINWYILVHTGINWYMLVHTSTYWYKLVHTGFYWYKLVHTGTHWYKLVHTGTHWYTLVHTGTNWHKLVPTSHPGQDEGLHQTRGSSSLEISNVSCVRGKREVLRAKSMNREVGLIDSLFSFSDLLME